MEHLVAGVPTDARDECAAVGEQHLLLNPNVTREYARRVSRE